jgi:NAD(P)-dependent dehydrogenase (short-subunit alcohol dehydrogenase family)
MPEMFDLKREIAVVFGGTGVLGGAMAEGLAQAGATVVVLGRDKERGQARVEAIKKEGGKAFFFQANATDRQSVREAKEKIQKEVGTPTVLVNAAGGNDPKVTVTDQLSFDNIQADDWRQNFELNVVGGALFPCQEFGPVMVKAGKGSIINIASVSAHLPLSRVVTYSAAKAAVLNLTQFLSREWAPFGVRVNSITPGFFPAEQNKRLLFNEDGTPTPRAKSILGHTSMNRFGESKELIGAVVFLASSSASGFVTGTDIRVDGGFLSQTI